jgi:hypothetical protein
LSDSELVDSETLSRVTDEAGGEVIVGAGVVALVIPVVPAAVKDVGVEIKGVLLLENGVTGLGELAKVEGDTMLGVVAPGLGVVRLVGTLVVGDVDGEGFVAVGFAGVRVELRRLETVLGNPEVNVSDAPPVGDWVGELRRLETTTPTLLVNGNPEVDVSDAPSDED